MDKQKKKILILSENDSMHRRVKKRLLPKPRYEVLWTDSYEKAYSDVTAGRVDFLFYEVNKALDDGMRNLDRMKKGNLRVPVVVSAVLERPEKPTGK